MAVNKPLKRLLHDNGHFNVSEKQSVDGQVAGRGVISKVRKGLMQRM
jgi:hypothetical protein